MRDVTAKDLELIKQATSIITKRYQRNTHQIGAAMITKSGKCFTAVSMDTHLGRAAICAEAIAFGMAAAATGETEIDTIVAVNKAGEVVSPCGICRELIADYSPNARVIVPSNNSNTVVLIRQLLPNKYQRNKELG